MSSAASDVYKRQKQNGVWERKNNDNIDTAAQLGTVYTDIILETRTVDLTRLQQNHEGTRKCVSELGRRAKSSLS